MRKLLCLAIFLLGACWAFPSVAPAAEEPNSAGIEFFEKKIRPVLVEHCYRCHSEEAQTKGKLKGGLLVDSLEGLLKGGDSGPALARGKAQESLLVKVLHNDNDLLMPPSGMLPQEVIDNFVRWIDMGAPDPRTGKVQRAEEKIDLEAARKLWAFRSPQKHAAPAVQNAAGPQSDIDRFILARLEAQGLQPAAPANPRMLLRRLSYDLIGLPPTPEEIDVFVGDSSPDALAKVVDRLLASPHFGVRWGRHWLDNVRYAEEDRPENGVGRTKLGAHLYRDWVVQAFNRDLPYDQFVRLQVAGHLLPPAPGELTNADNLTATAVWGLGVMAEVTEMERERAYADNVDDQIDLLGRAFLGLTLACARCHDHKFDPISQQNYYGLAGIFASSHVITSRSNRVAEPVFRTPDAEAQYRKNKDELAVAEKKLTELEKNKNKADPSELAEIRKERDRLRGVVQKQETRVVVQEGPIPKSRQETIGDVPLLVRGDYRNLGPKVPRHFPTVLCSSEDCAIKSAESGRRELAEWLTRPDHPLTARVMVNRVWQQLFGWGIVRSSGNFGKLGEPPTHPELLDTLAVRFVEQGWSVKKLIREIVLSRTYQQSSLGNEAAERADPDNRLLARMNRRRLDAEQMRDTLLAVSGGLARQPQPEKLAESGRSLYVKVTRTGDNSEGMLSLFDGANPSSIVPHRHESTSAPQALFMLNNGFVAKAAEKAAANLKGNDDERIGQAYRLVLGRAAQPGEIEIGRQILVQAREDQGSRNDQRNWAHYCQVLFCLNEFMYLD